MEHRRPLSPFARFAVHAFVGVCFAATIAYFYRETQERHIALGMHGTSNQHFVYVRPGSVAHEAGVREGDRLDNPTRAWLDGFFADKPTYSFPVARGPDTLQIRLPIQHDASLGERLASMPPDMITAALVGLLALLLGWWIFVRAPDAESVLPFVLWSAATAPFWVGQSWSAYWSTEMWTINTLWAIPAESMFQAFALHWLLVFPTRLVKRKWIVGIYVLFALLSVVLVVIAFATADKPTDEMALKGLLVSAVAVALCLLQLRRAPTIKTRRRASWVLLAVLTFSIISFFAWDAPHLARIALPISDMSITSFVSLCYLIIPISIAIAVTREGLFRIDRIVTTGMALGGAVVVIFLMYVGAVVILAQFLELDDRSSIPVFWGFVIACTLAVLFRPVQRNLERAFDSTLLRRQQRYDDAIRRFEESLSTAVTPDALAHLICKSVSDAIGVVSCSVSDERVDLISIAPGQVRADSYSGHLSVSEAMSPEVAVRYPIAVGGHYYGCLDLGPKEGDRFSDDDFVFLERMALRAADQSARLTLQAKAVRRELEFAKTRLRIASDLHDDIGSNLSGLALMSESVDGDPRDQEVVLGKIGEFARSMVDSLRDIVWSIDPESDRASHLVDRMHDSAAALLRGVDHSISADVDHGVGLDPVVQRNIFLIFKEAINNAARHSGASRVVVYLTVRDGAIELIVEDNGSGFDTSDRSEGMGKRSMARRAEQIGGHLDIESKAGTGTRVTLSTRMAQTRHSHPVDDL